MKKPLLLAILDGWGFPEKVFPPGDAINQADKPNFEYLWDNYPHTILASSGEEVGLPEGQMGNSEVGHLNIGAGRIVYQELTRINKALREGSFSKNVVLQWGMDECLKNNKALHLMGLLSDGGVHSHLEHLYALLEMAREKNIKNVYIHAFLDGRDVAPTSGIKYIKALEEKCHQLGLGQIATVMGRYYAMDRDKRWERIELAYRALVEGEGKKATMASMAIEQSYESKETDEFVKPTVIVDETGEPIATIKTGDTIIFYNFRADRARQITRTFVDEDFSYFKLSEKCKKVNYICMTQYEADIKAPVAFPPQDLENTLGEVLSKKGLKQLRIAETEKYAHVTFFFNGGIEEPNQGEDRILIPSPKVATYNLQPEMSACQIADKVNEKIQTKEYDFILLNFANPDMVGHTGDLKATIKAIEVVDQCLGKIYKIMQEVGGTLLITADHGNAECMLERESQKPITAHTCNSVPFILVRDDLKNSKLRAGSLQDIAPTILELMKIEQPKEMTGKSLLSKQK